MMNQIDNDNQGKECGIDCARVSLAMAFVPYQEFKDLYEPDFALERGTLFAELDKPFIGEEALSRE